MTETPRMFTQIFTLIISLVTAEPTAYAADSLLATLCCHPSPSGGPDICTPPTTVDVNGHFGDGCVFPGDKLITCQHSYYKMEDGNYACA